MIELAFSILAADFAHLADEIGRATAGGGTIVHVDVMDGHFVPNITFGPPVVKAIRPITTLPIDCHLMITDPDGWAPRYAAAGAGNVTLHVEAADDPVRTARAIRGEGARAGVAIKPATSVESVADLLPEFDMLLVMTVEPGFGGQQFRADTLPKLAAARRLLDRHGLQLWLQVDGGVAADTIEACAAAGADVFVAGSAVYGAGDPAAAIAGLRRLAQAARPQPALTDPDPE